MICVITGKETKSMSHNIPLTVAAIKAVKKLKEERPHYTTRQCIRDLQIDYMKLLDEKATEQIEAKLQGNE